MIEAECTNAYVSTNTSSKLTLEQEVNVILNRMVAEAKQADIVSDMTKKNAIINAATDLERKGYPLNDICHRITSRSVDMNVSGVYVRKYLPEKYKNQEQRQIRYSTLRNNNEIHEGDNSITSTNKIVEIKSKEDIEPLIPMTRKGKSSNNGVAFDPSVDLVSLQGIALDKLPEEFRPFLVKLIKENKLLKASNAKLRERNNDLKFEDSHKQGLIDNLMKHIVQFRKNFADNYESKYSQFQARIDQVEAKNASFHYMLVGLAGISELGISDEMRLDTVNNFIKKHYDRIVEQLKLHKEEEAIIQAENLKSWEK